MTRHERFRRIEGSRPDDAPVSESADRARIAAVIDSAPAPRGSAPLDLDFGPRAGPAAPAEPARTAASEPELSGGDSAPDIALETAPVQGQPFVRCAACGVDNTIHAKRCDGCQAELDTDAQRAFNERLWDERLRAAEREREALARLAEARAEQRRQRSVRPPGISETDGAKDPSGEEELHAADEEAPPFAAPGWRPVKEGDVPLALALLRRAGLRKHRWAPIVGLGAVAVGLAAIGGAARVLGWILTAALFAAMFPRSWFRRWLG